MRIIYYFLIALAVFEFLFGVFIAWTFIKGAPWAPTRKEKVHKMFSMANIKQNELVYDLGCGDGRVLVIAAKQYNARAVGIEIDPIRYLWCKIRILVLGLGKRVDVKFGDFFNTNLSDADIVICYLSQKTNEKLQSKLKEELQPNARIVSNLFTFSDLNLKSKDENLKIYAYDMDSQK
ncbi:MAG: methyltransferase domain-containing protein [Asgard group archaeon]|nr:methyltransferase domain-containing protein [Asgard group archaeon]